MNKLLSVIVALSFLGTPAWAQNDSKAANLHLLNRITFGPTAADLTEIQRLGWEAYLQRQLNPQAIAEPQQLVSYVGSLDAVRLTPLELFRQYGPPAIAAAKDQLANAGPNQTEQANATGNKTEASDDKQSAKKQQAKARKALFKEIGEQTTYAKMIRAVNSPKQLEEVMTDFWFNHFNVSINKGLDHIWVASYEQEAIRPFALGKFRDLLESTSHHPAMLFYLDNWQNTAPGSPGSKGKQEGLNENYARELMELHTLGVDGGYSQTDVIQLAKILTGLGLPPRKLGQIANGGPGSGRFGAGRFAAAQLFNNNGGGQQGGEISPFGSYFDPRRHDYGDKLFLGYRIKGSGANEFEEALDILARSPATAHHISYQLAQYFVCDNPPKSLVDKLAARFSRSDGDIKAVLNDLFHSTEFWDPQNAKSKYKNPFRYAVSAMRVANTQPDNYRPILGFLQQQGMPLYGCLTPDGYKNTKEAWLNPDSILRRINLASALSAGKLPGATVPEADYGSIEKVMSAYGVSGRTAATVTKAPDQMRTALLLGSPEFMHY